MFNINHTLLEISGFIRISSVIVTSHITVTILTPVLEIGNFVTSLQRITTKKVPLCTSQGWSNSGEKVLLNKTRLAVRVDDEL